jgi:hypothetical protein
VVGVEDHDNEIVGADFFDDSRIQNLVNAYLEHPPKIQYENIQFPNLSKDKVLGLVTIGANAAVSYFKKGIHTIPARSIFVRRGSNSQPADWGFEKSNQNEETVLGIENNSRNSIGDTLDGVMDFMNVRHKNMQPKYKVFKEMFILCWAGIPKKNKGQTFYSRVDIELINEQIKLFYSVLDDVQIEFDDDQFTITEYVSLGLNDKTSFYPLERVSIYFEENGYYKIDREMLFSPPEFNKKMLFHIYNSNLALISKMKKGLELSNRETKDLENISSTLMICYLNGFDDAKEQLIAAKPFLKAAENKIVYIAFKEVMRILRKMKYDVN